MDMAVQYSDQGIFIPTEDLIRQYVPRLATIYEEHPEYKQGSTTPNGHSFGFPYIEEMYGLVRTRGPFMINTQWLEKVKFLMPWNLETGTVLVLSILFTSLLELLVLQILFAAAMRWRIIYG